VPGKAPLYLEGENPQTAIETARNVGVEMSAAAHASLYSRCRRGDAADGNGLPAPTSFSFDGTLFRDDEMIATGTGTKTGRRMGHMPIDGEDGSSGRPRAALLLGASMCTSTTPIRS
jgi:pyrroloquinoline quinone biosynthesis protein B